MDSRGTPSQCSSSLDKSSALKMASTPTKNKRFTTRFDADPLFVPGGAPTAHEVLSEGGIFRRNRIGPHSDNPVRYYILDTKSVSCYDFFMVFSLISVATFLMCLTTLGWNRCFISSSLV